MYTVDVLIPTYRPEEAFRRLIMMLKKQTYPVGNIIIINTEEKEFPDWNIRTALLITHIKKSEFDHGGSRDYCIGCSKADLVLCMTQDAIPADTELVARMVEYFKNDKVASCYARQVPLPDANPIERYTRSFNYPPEPFIKGKDDMPRLGIKTFFCSNVCAMYKRSVYEELGGFPSPAIFNEDMVYNSRLVRAGYMIAYAADAVVMHSHNYSAITQFRRNFDLGVSQVMFSDDFKGVSSESEGKALVRKTAGFLKENKLMYLIPKLLLHSAFKYAGYRFGKAYKRLPHFAVRFFSMNRAFWEETSAKDISRNSSIQ